MPDVAVPATVDLHRGSLVDSAASRVAGRFAAAQRDRECRAPFGIVAGIDGATMRVDDRSDDRQADPEAVRFRRDEWREQRADRDPAGTPGPGVAHRDFDIGRP